MKNIQATDAVRFDISRLNKISTFSIHRSITETDRWNLVHIWCLCDTGTSHQHLPISGNCAMPTDAKGRSTLHDNADSTLQSGCLSDHPASVNHAAHRDSPTVAQKTGAPRAARDAAPLQRRTSRPAVIGADKPHRRTEPPRQPLGYFQPELAVQ